jgi:hypothetical protein
MPAGFTHLYPFLPPIMEMSYPHRLVLKLSWMSNQYFSYKGMALLPLPPPLLLWWCVEGKECSPGGKRYILIMQWMQAKELKRLWCKEARLFCVCDKIQNHTFNKTREWIIVHIFLHTLDQTCIRDRYQWSPVQPLIVSWKPSSQATLWVTYCQE